jgi:uncharacterized protein (TIGR03435 family)
MRTSRRLFTCLFLGLTAAFAQTGSHAAFEAASVKPSSPDARGTIIAMPPGGRLEIANMTLKEMIGEAYHIQPYQISGGPAWLDSTHYDISAKVGKEVKRDDVLVMLQALLADRFHLTIRREVRQLPIYALVLAHRDGQPGPKLIESKAGGCTEPDPVNPFAVDPAKLCGNFALGPDGLTLNSATIGSLAPRLSRLIGRNVIDKTGLTKRYDVNIEWTPDESFFMRLPPGERPAQFDGPSIFTVFRDQLGIAFRSGKGPVEILVIQRAEKPAEN